jgi:hypothetical protein
MSVKSMHEALMEMAQNQLDEAVSVEKKGRMIVVKDGKSNTFPLHSEEQAMIKKLKDGQTVKFKDETGTEVTAARKGDMVHLSNKMSNKKTPVAYSNFNESFERAAWVPESIADEQVEAFMEAALAAAQEGKDTFVFEAKHYKAKSKKEAKKLDPVGKADADIDNDGDVDSSDEYLHKRRKAIKKAMDEALDAKDTDTVKAVVKALKGASKAHAGQAKQLKKDLEDSAHTEMDPKKHVKYNDEMKMYCVYNKDGKVVAKFEDEEEANAYAMKNHDALMGREEMDEAAAAGSTAQHGPDASTQDTYDKQMSAGENDIPMSRKKDIVDKHTAEVALDAEAIYKQNQEEAENALKQTSPRLGDQRNGDTSFVNPIKAEIVDGITKALQQMKTNS